jgi:hypothetical protein
MELDMKVFTYFNLHKKLFSIKALEGEKKGRVIAHLPYVCIENPKFKVSKAGRERVLREQRKNVHAGVVGEFTTHLLSSDKVVWENVRYNPYLFDSFVDDDNKPVAFADVAFMQVKPITNKPVIQIGTYEVEE